MRIEPQISTASIVLLGSFNPSIFQPFWLAKHDLISNAAAESAEVAIIHPEVTEFAIDGQFNLRVQRERFRIDRASAPLILISDIVGRIFGDLLPHVPVTALGINRLVHFDMGSQGERDRIGELLAPRDPWGPWGKEVSSGDGIRHGGMQSLTLIQRNVSGRPNGWILAKIEPSSLLRLTGIYMEVNDHYDFGAAGEGTDATAATRTVQAQFDNSIRAAEGIIDQIMSLKK